MQPDELPLQVGDTVTYNNHVAAMGISGTVVARLGQDILRVKWSDLSVPRTHRGASLKRVVAADSRRTMA
jgi:hypothetical protein